MNVRPLSSFESKNLAILNDAGVISSLVFVTSTALKKAILHRKNSSFYKTCNGAYTGDVFMSLIHTTELCGGNTFEYLVALLRNPKAVEATPADWLPWTYQATLRARVGPTAFC